MFSYYVGATGKLTSSLQMQCKKKMHIPCKNKRQDIAVKSLTEIYLPESQ